MGGVIGVIIFLLIMSIPMWGEAAVKWLYSYGAIIISIAIVVLLFVFVEHLWAAVLVSVACIVMFIGFINIIKDTRENIEDFIDWIKDYFGK